MKGAPTRPRRGLFVTFEGIEGSGKSTQVRRAAEELAGRGVPHVVTRQPGGTPLGGLLRDVLLRSSGRLDPGAELLLLFADRRQDLTEHIEPALAEAKVVLCDRYSDASRAYQGAGRGLGEALVDKLHRSFGCLDPDRTYVFDLPVETALARLAGRGERDRFEREDLAFHRRVRAAYRRRAAREPRRFIVLDARGDEDAIFEELARDLLALVAKR